MDMLIISQSKKMERYEKRGWEGGEREGRWEEVLDSSEMAQSWQISNLIVSQDQLEMEIILNLIEIGHQEPSKGDPFPPSWSWALE